MTVTDTGADGFPLASMQVIVYVVSVARGPVQALPLVAVLDVQPLAAEQDAALTAVHEIKAWAPGTTLSGIAVRFTVTGSTATVTDFDAETVPLASVQVIE